MEQREISKIKEESLNEIKTLKNVIDQKNR